MSKRIIPLRISIFLGFFLTFLCINQTFAIDNTHLNAEQPIEIYASTAEFEDKKGTATYKGSVVMDQGNHHLTSDVLVILRDKSGKIESMIATGEPASFHVKPNLDKPELLGHAKIIEFYPKQDKILLFENAELTQNNETIRGENLTYFLVTHVLLANPVAGKKTTVILAPNKSPLPNVSPTGTRIP
jgi:lipopolysaccharide transport protein LptA